MLPLLIELGWKSALIAGAALIADRMLRGRPAAERVFVLRLAIGLLLALPVAVLLLPSLDLAWLPAPVAPAPAVPVVAASAALPAALPPNPRIDVAGLFYAGGVGAVMLHLALGIAILMRWTRRGAPVDGAEWTEAMTRATARLRRPVRLLVSRDVTTPISWGIAPAWILIDATTLERAGQADAVLAHEAAHIRRFDWPMLVAARIAVALFWFNPLVWLLARTLARRGETAADEAAVRGIERADYAEALLAFAAAPATRAAATGMALWPNALAERIAHIAMHRQRRGSRAVPVVALACVALAAPPLAAARLVHAVPAEPVSRTAWPDRVVSRPRPGTTAAARTPSAERPVAAGIASSGVTNAPVAAPQAVIRPGTSGSGPVRVAAIAEPVQAAASAPQLANAPRPAPQEMRIVGQGGAEVVRNGDSVTITAARVAAPTPATEETPDWAKHAADEVSQAAVEMRKGAREVELTAELPGVTAAKRAEIRDRVKLMRATADEFDARARALRGRGG
ncbi:M56 family metallopeptidase [Sphingomonas sp. MS122]|uniref:M56 family metallopeptidase n=1 Tax=Sphingomonas sp. MS122 TaxID=3412683 RepID=UPI003C2E0C2E